MTEISLGKGDSLRRQDAFADGALLVHSPKGLNPSERALLNALPQGRSGAALVVNSAEGLAGMALRALNPNLAVHCHFDDAWDLDGAKATVAAHPALAPELGIAPDPPEGLWDYIALPLSMTGVKELLRERLAFAAERLKPGGLLFTSTDNPNDRFLRDEVVELFGSATTVPGPTRRSGVAYIARRPKGLKLRKRPHERTFTVREGEDILDFVSRPGVFSHGHLDEGTRALLALAEMGEAKRVLDLGCGAGVVGVVAARRCPQACVTFVDSYARAIECTRRNIEAHGLAARCDTLLTANPLDDLGPGYDLVLTNPPYYGNYRISQMFLDTAAKVLVPGGRIVLVTKGDEWHRAAMKQLFTALHGRKDKGYWVFLATQPDLVDGPGACSGQKT